MSEPGKKLLFVSVGTRGDVQPYVIYANALIQAGYRVAIATHAPFESFVAANSQEITFFPLLGDPDGLMFSREFVEVLYKGSVMQLGKLLFAAQDGYIDENLSRLAKACEEYAPDAIIASIVTITECLALCQKHTIPMMIVSTIPFYANSEIPLVTLSPTSLGFGWLNRLTYSAGNSSLWMMIGARFNKYRQTLGLPQQSSFWGLDFLPILHIYSPKVGHCPADWPIEVRTNTIGFLTESNPHYTNHATLTTITTTEHVTTPEGIPVVIHNVSTTNSDSGSSNSSSDSSNSSNSGSSSNSSNSSSSDSSSSNSCSSGSSGSNSSDEKKFTNEEKISSNYVPDARLGNFLSSGDKPVYIGFGSMPMLSASTTFIACAQALKQLNLRGLFYLKSAQSAELTEAHTAEHSHMLVFAGAPHEWLLPRCVAAVHHGGAGTTAASVRAGIPTIIFSILGDQPYWASRCALLGVGPPNPVPLKNLTADNLAAQIRISITPQVQLTAQKLGEQVRQEDATKTAVAKVHELFKAFPVPKRTVSWEFDEKLNCTKCATAFSFLTRRHHCRACLRTFCASCLTKEQIYLWPDVQFLCSDPVCRRHIKFYAPLRVHIPPSSDPTLYATPIPSPAPAPAEPTS